LYVKDKGIVIADGADAFIKNTKVTGAKIGIKTIGGGKLTVKNTDISHGEKGFYLQYGKNVDIRNCDVSHNKEEAIDIRANVDGIITDNTIESNKESGIEVIAGRSSLIITNNKLKHNNSSGIAVQFYKSTKQIGHLKISGNTLVGNRRYGVDCKIPSGGNPMPGYWEKSINFQYNTVSGNGLGGLSKFCKFSDESILNATKTAEEIEKMKKEEAEKKIQAEQDATEKAKIAEAEKRKIEEERKKEEQKRADLDVADEIEQIFEKNVTELEMLRSENKKMQARRSKIKVFFMGVDNQVLDNFKKQLTFRENSLHEGQKLVSKIKTDEVKKAVEKQTNEANDKLKNLQESYNKYKNQFALIPWVKNLLNLNK
jgi:parallel beta-helix repeat protein